MEKMIFHWEKGNEKGHFMVSALTVDECIDIANEESEKFGAEVMDYYSI